MHAQIVADTLGMPYDAIEVNAADTGVVPDSGPTVASRTCMIVGRILQRCAEDMRERLGTADAARSTATKHGPLVVTKEYEQPPGIDVGRRHAIAAMPTAATAGAATSSRSRSIPMTWQVHADRRSPTVHEIGKAIHPMLATGQIEGGTAQGLGYALLEEVVMRDGRMANAQLTNYIIPTTLDTPPMDVVDARESVHARTVRREGRRRDADRRTGAGGRQRAAARGLRSFARFRRRRRRS